MHVFGTTFYAALGQRELQAVREAVVRNMQRPFDVRADRDIVSQVSRELGTREEIVARQVTAVRLQAAQAMTERVRRRASAGFHGRLQPPLSGLAAVQAQALATRDALSRVYRLSKGMTAPLRSVYQRRVDEFMHAQEAALMDRWEQSDEQLAQDFEAAVHEILDAGDREGAGFGVAEPPAHFLTGEVALEEIADLECGEPVPRA